MMDMNPGNEAERTNPVKSRTSADAGSDEYQSARATQVFETLREFLKSAPGSTPDTSLVRAELGALLADAQALKLWVGYVLAEQRAERLETFEREFMDEFPAVTERFMNEGPAALCDEEIRRLLHSWNTLISLSDRLWDDELPPPENTDEPMSAWFMIVIEREAALAYSQDPPGLSVASGAEISETTFADLVAPNMDPDDGLSDEESVDLEPLRCDTPGVLRFLTARLASWNLLPGDGAVQVPKSTGTDLEHARGILTFLIRTPRIREAWDRVVDDVFRQFEIRPEEIPLPVRITVLLGTPTRAFHAADGGPMTWYSDEIAGLLLDREALSKFALLIHGLAPKWWVGSPDSARNVQGDEAPPHDAEDRS